MKIFLSSNRTYGGMEAKTSINDIAQEISSNGTYGGMEVRIISAWLRSMQRSNGTYEGMEGKLIQYYSVSGNGSNRIYEGMEEGGFFMLVKGYKGFDQNFRCRDFQFQPGGEYEESDAIICEKGFHFCEFPFDVFNYYAPTTSRYAEVEGDGKIVKHDDGSKVSCTNLRVGAEIDLNDLISAGVKYIMDRANWDSKKESNTKIRSVAINIGDQSVATNTGNMSIATNTGDQSVASNSGNWSATLNTGNQSVAINAGEQSVATNTGYQSVAANTGDKSVVTNIGVQSVATNTGRYSIATNAGIQSVALNTGRWSVAKNTGNWSTAISIGSYSVASVFGKESVAVAIGINGRAKGALGCWLVLAEWEENEDGYCIKDVQCARVDGKIIKADTWYQLKGGKFVEWTGEMK